PQGEQLSEQDFTVIADADGRAEISTEAIDMPIGWVSYVTAIDGSDVNAAWTSDWGIPAETVHRPPEDKPSSPPAPPENPETPPVAPVAETPPAPSAELPRTGATGTGMLIGLSIVLVG